MSIIDDLREKGIEAEYGGNGAVRLPELTEKEQEIADGIINPPDYKVLRCAEYPSILEQLDMIFHDMENGTDLWKEKIRFIKNKYPKPKTS